MQGITVSQAESNALRNPCYTASDEQTGIVTATDYAQVWPTTGMEQGHTVTATKDGDVVLEQTSNTLTTQNTALTGGTVVYPYVQSSLQLQHHDLDGSALPLSVNCIASIDNDGNVTQRLQSVSLTVGTPGLPCQQGTYSTTTQNVYLNNTGQPYLIGLVTDSSVTKTAPGQANITRTVQFDYYGMTQAAHATPSSAISGVSGITGMPEDQVVEAGVPSLALQSTYSRDGYGNIIQTIQNWQDPAVANTSNAAVTRIQSGATYDTLGRFPQTVQNATCFNGGVCQSETHTYDAATGAKASITDINNLTTSWTVNGFGRVLTETHPDHTQNLYYQKQCAGTATTCPGTQGGTPVMVGIIDHVTDSTLGASRIAVPELNYADSAGHHLRSQSWGFDPSKVPEIDTDVTYDNIGHLQTSYYPAYAGDPQVMASTDIYDDLSRVTEVDTLDENNTKQTATTAYNGLSVTYTNQKTQQKTETHDLLGQLIQVKDALRYVTTMTRDAFGNLLTTIDPNGNVVTVGYDTLGRKTSLQDPDLGLITYGIDPRGLQYQQTNPIQRAAGQSTTFTHDVLDRLTQRVDASDLTSYWIYDQLPTATAAALPTATANLCNSGSTNGKLVEATTWNGPLATGSKDYDRVQCYDSLSRPVATATNLYSNTYTSTTGYDAWSRTSSITHQAGSSTPKVFAQYYNGNGYLAQVARITNSGAPASTTQILWQATQQDASDRVLTAALGNGLTVNRSYFTTTGLLSDGNLTNAGNSEILQEGYFYDVLGNVTTRTQFWNTSQTGYVEGFTYDALNRLTNSQVSPNANGSPALQSFTYDPLGNITGKTGVGSGVQGSYHYGGAAQTGCASNAATAGVHAVTNIDGYGTFCYDANGNVLSGGGRSMTWNSFDMPVTISNGQSTSTFIYGPEHQRTRQVRDGGNIVYADAMEMDIPAGGTTATATLKTYWPMGLGVEIDSPTSSTTQLRWTHVDRLGSVVAITNETGSLAESMAFDAWGSRRDANGDPAVIAVTASGQLDGQVEIDNKGYTGQEELDKLALVHLNGRVYDPLTSRFISADPEIQDPSHSQSYNRYTYVWNNPTNLTDPTGFNADEDARKKAQEKAREECSKSAAICFVNQVAGNALAWANGLVSSNTGASIQSKPQSNALTSPDAKQGGAANSGTTGQATTTTQTVDANGNKLPGPYATVVVTAKRPEKLKMIPLAPEESGYYTYGTPLGGLGQYARHQAITTLFNIENRWAENHTEKFGVGNISLEHGGPFAPHATHQDGLEIDIRPLRKDGADLPVTWHDPQYDRAATQTLVNTIKASGTVKSIYFNDPQIEGVQPMVGHDNHLHLNVKSE